jgi:type IV pilus assembly protein PilB
VYGEKAVIRVLGNRNLSLHRRSLGINDRNMKMLDEILNNPNGIILVSGPTGSGKTTTLYAILREFNKIDSNIVTVEDPVEYRIAGVNQVQVNTKAGLTFATGLRSILRQDPDTIMVGEIRDNETAEIAVRAAITGHRVLSTIHTNDAASTVIRLVDMGIDPYLVSSSLVGVIAQRLVRKVCPRCSYTYQADEHELGLLKLEPGAEVTLMRGKGCPYCNSTGYKGRTAIHEIMVMNRELRHQIDSGANVDELRDLTKKFGTGSLTENCRELVMEGVTTIEEMIKVTYSI